MKKILLFLALIILVLGVWWVVDSERTTGDMVYLSTVGYTCEDGKTIQASYAEDHVHLELSDGRALDLPQTGSGAGIEYQKDGTLFASSGQNAFLKENNVTTYKNCVQDTSDNGTTTDDENTSGETTTYTSTAGGFTFSYPSQFSVAEENPSGQSWMELSTTTGTFYVRMNIPETFQPNTNFSEAWFKVGSSDSPAAVVACDQAPGASITDEGTATINGVTFNKFSFGDAGAGNFYNTTSYRTVHNGSCYAVEYTIHSTNIGNYPADSGITEFDESQVTNVLESVARSFTFTD